MNQLTLNHPEVFRCLSDSGFLRGALSTRLSSVYTWSFGFYDREITKEKIEHLFGGGTQWRLNTVYKSDDPQPWSGPWSGYVERFFASPSEKRQKYMVVALASYLDFIRKGRPTTLGWSARMPPSHGFVFWEGADGKIEAKRVL